MDTRNSILNAAALVFSQHGFRGSTTRRIADAASVNEVTIFRYFGSKEALLQEAIRHSSGSGLFKSLPKQPLDPVRELSSWSSAMLDEVHSRRGMIRQCMSEMGERPEISGCAAEAPVQATNELCAYFRHLKAAGFTREAFDATAAAAMLIGAIFHDGMGRDMMPDVYPKPANKAAGRYAQLVLRAIGVRTGEPRIAHKPASRKPNGT